MKRKTLLFFELFLVILAIFALLNYPGYQKFLIALPCLVGALMTDKQASRLAERDAEEYVQGKDLFNDPEKEGRKEALNILLKNKNALVLADAVNLLLKDLGIKVLPTPDRPNIDRILEVPELQGKFGLIVVNDVSALDRDRTKWGTVADFDRGNERDQRLLIIASNSATDEDGGKFREFSTDAQGFLSTKHIVAMTTRTFGKIYQACKKKSVSPRRIFRLIQQHPGGVFSC